MSDTQAAAVAEAVQAVEPEANPVVPPNGRRFADGRVICRGHKVCPSTGATVPFFAVSGREPLHMREQTDHRTTGARWDDARKQHNGRFSVLAFEEETPHPGTQEAGKLRALGLHETAAMLEKHLDLRPCGSFKGVFDAGRVFYDLRFTEERYMPVMKALRGLVDRHTSGDLGEHGSVAKAKPTADDEWAPGLAQEANVRAALALKRGDGFVVSQYAVTCDPLPAESQANVVKVLIATRVGCNGNETMATFGGSPLMNLLRG